MTGDDFLPYGRHLVEDDDIDAVVRVLRGDWLTTGPTVERFEQAFATTVSARHATACSNGTAALHLGCLALGLGPGDHAVVPALTFVATANAVRLAQAEVVLADVDPDTGLMTPDHLTAALARAEGPVKAALPVHLAGQCADLGGLAEVARAKGLTLFEDACHALGTEYAGAPVGNCRHSSLTAFSLHPVKIIAMGEGGVVTTNDDELASRLGRLRNHGRSGAEMTELGLNYRVSDIHCALGLSQLAKLERFVARRRALVGRYDELIGALDPWVRPVARVPDCAPAWHLYPVLIDFQALGLDRAKLTAALREKGIGSQVHYLPLHRQPYYAERYGALELPGAEAYHARTLSLPLFPAMADSDVERVVTALAGVLEER